MNKIIESKERPTRNVEIVDQYEIAPYSFIIDSGIDLQKIVCGIMGCLLGFVFLGVAIRYGESENVKDRVWNFYLACIVCLAAGVALIYRAYYDKYRLLDENPDTTASNK